MGLSSRRLSSAWFGSASGLEASITNLQSEAGTIEVDLPQKSAVPHWLGLSREYVCLIVGYFYSSAGCRDAEARLLSLYRQRRAPRDAQEAFPLSELRVCRVLGSIRPNQR